MVQRKQVDRISQVNTLNISPTFIVIFLILGSFPFFMDHCNICKLYIVCIIYE